MLSRHPLRLTQIFVSASLAIAAIGPVAARADDPRPKKVSKSVKPITDAECQEVADAITAAVAAGDTTALNRQIGWDALYAKVTGGIDAPEAFRKSFLQGLDQTRLKGQGFTGVIAATAKSGGDYSLLRIHNTGQQRRLLFRLLSGDQRLNYHDFVLARQADGTVKAEDIHVFLSGELLSQTFRRFYQLALVQATKNTSFLDRLTGADKKSAQFFDVLNQVNEANQAKDYAKVLTLTRTLDPEIRKDKGILLIRMIASQQTNDDEYQQVLEEFRKNYPTDACVDMLSIDYFALKKQYREALGCVDRADRAVEGDPHIENLRAAVYLEMNDLPKARAAAQKAVAALPMMTPGYWTLITVALRQKDYPEVLRNLRLLRDKLGMEFGDMNTVAEYKDFVRSPEYQVWLKETKPKPAEETKPAQAPKN